MDVLVKNVSIAGKTEAEVQALLAQAHSMFAGCTVSFAAVGAEVKSFEQQLVSEVHAAMAAIKSLFGMSSAATPAAVVAAVQVAATPEVVAAVAESPVVAEVAAAPALTVAEVVAKAP
jgi:hypothetical protein